MSRNMRAQTTIVSVAVALAAVMLSSDLLNVGRLRAQQTIKKVDMGEAPMTIAMVIEFSNLFQRYYTNTWYQTLQLSWG